MRVVFLLLILGCEWLASAQPPKIRRNPQGQQQQQPDQKQNTILPGSVNITGTVREASKDAVLVEASDTRFLNFKITSATQFGKGVTAESLKAGDAVKISGTQNDEAFLTATSIALDESKPRAAAPPEEGPGERPTLMHADGAAPKETTAAATTNKPPTPYVDPEDSGKPVLRHGKPAPKPGRPESESEPAEAAVAGNAPPAPVRQGVEAPAPAPAPEQKQLDSKQQLVERARESALSFTETLPNYVCQQFTTRYVRASSATGWQAKDIVSANVVYENGKEDYRNIAINGKQVTKKMEELPGSWSTGEFGTILRSLFHPGRAAEFKYAKQTQINGLTAWVYDYSVKRENSDWRVQLGSQSIIPAYEGRVWIDTKSGRTLRIEMEAVDIPEAFPLDHVESASDYGFVRLATADQYLLPTHAETLSCERGTPYCARNAIDFRNYRKYSGEANITFDVAPDDKPQPEKKK